MFKISIHFDIFCLLSATLCWKDKPGGCGRVHGDCRCSQCHSHADLHVLQVSFSDAQIGMRSTFLLGKAFLLTKCKGLTIQHWRLRLRSTMRLLAGMERLKVESRYVHFFPGRSHGVRNWWWSWRYPEHWTTPPVAGNDWVEYICQCPRHRVPQRRWWTPLFWLSSCR